MENTVIKPFDGPMITNADQLRHGAWVKLMELDKLITDHRTMRDHLTKALNTVMDTLDKTVPQRDELYKEYVRIFGAK